MPSNAGCRCTVACALVVRADAWRRKSTGTEENMRSSGALELRTSTWKEPTASRGGRGPMVLSV